MFKQNLIFNDLFWKFLVSLETLKERKDKNLFCSSLGIDEELLNEFWSSLNKFDISCERDDDFIYPLNNKCLIKMEFNLSEWLAMQATLHIDNQHLKEQNNGKYYFQKIVTNKMMIAQKAFELFNLYKKSCDDKNPVNNFENIKRKIDYNICGKQVINIHFLNNQTCLIYPHRLIFFDGLLCIVGENIHDKALIYFGVEDILDIEETNNSNNPGKNYEPNYSQIEINDFICHLRLINDREERLVLKIYGQSEADLLPSYHYLGNPYVTTNGEGDTIWAATIEACDDLFQWLYSMKDRVEVLDPDHMRVEFANFCELQKEHSGFKKAS